MRILTDYHYRKGYWEGARAALLAFLPLFLGLDALVLMARNALPSLWIVLTLAAWPAMALVAWIYSLIIELIAKRINK